MTCAYCHTPITTPVPFNLCPTCEINFFPPPRKREPDQDDEPEEDEDEPYNCCEPCDDCQRSYGPHYTGCTHD